MIEIFDDNNNLIFLKLKNYWIIYLYNEENQIKYWRNSYNHSEIYMNQMKEYRHRTYTGNYEGLEEHEVFVFGSNMDGYHGSGNAGYACHGAMKLYEPDTVIDFANTPRGWVGAYAIKGIYEGLMQAYYGKSYALPTVLHAGDRKSIPKEELIENIQRFYKCCREHPELEFILAYGAEPHLRCGYTLEEFVKLFVDADEDIPKNIVFNKNFYTILIQTKLDKEIKNEQESPSTIKQKG